MSHFSLRREAVVTPAFRRARWWIADHAYSHPAGVAEAPSHGHHVLMTSMRIVPWRLVAPLWLSVLCATTSAVADDVSVSVESRVLRGNRPALTLRIEKDLKQAKLSLQAESRKHREVLGPAKAGTTLRFELPHTEAGRRTWGGELAVLFSDGSSGSMPLRFETEVIGPLEFRVLNDQADIREQHRLVVEADRALSRAEVEVYGEDEVLLASQAVSLEQVPAKTPVTVNWIPGRVGPVLRVQLTVYDDKGTHRTGQFFPFVVSVPHDEVVFESGRHEIRVEEEAKLVAALEQIGVTTKRYQRGVAVGGGVLRLFVSGFTDTVGSSSANLALSERRARAIGQWFQRHDVSVPIFVRGFGEEGLRVSTPDETDEERNRRTDYDLSVDGPTGSLHGWTKL
ncbi:MAG: OmpA family protein [Myxococcota bacterium]